MALEVQRNPGWRPIAVISLAASGLLVVFLLLPWGNASFPWAIVTVFAWIGLLRCAWRRITPNHPVQADERGALTAATL